jgi:hypothetical protein
MKQANKFMVVPYEEKKETVKQESKSPNTKITDIVNNKNLNKQDKVKLINQLLVKKQPNWPISDEFPSNLLDETDNEIFDDFDDANNEDSFNNTKLNTTLNKTLKNVKSIKKKKNPASVFKTLQKKQIKRLGKRENNESVINNLINNLNETTNNGEFFLPPYVATRQQKANIVNPVNLTDGVIQKSILDLAKLKQKTIKKKPGPKPCNIPSRNSLKKQKEILNQSVMDVEQTGGNFWSIYKK